MKALVFTGPKSYALQDRPLPHLLSPTDALIRVSKTTICGTDLHILNGACPNATFGRILGHEGIGDIVAVGSQVKDRKVGDRVLISCITSCGTCEACLGGKFGHCTRGGTWLLGHVIDGCQTEVVRVPFVDFSTHLIPKGVKRGSPQEESFLMLSDILPTAYEIGVLDGKLKEGDVMAVVGVGPVGLAVVATAVAKKPKIIIAVDVDANRLERAIQLGATHAVNNTAGDAVQQIMKLTENRGVDVVVEAIGTPIGWSICEDVVAAGGNIAVLGVHGKPATINLQRLWYKNFSMTAGIVSTHTIPELMSRVVSGELKPLQLISHHFKMSQLEDAYYTFQNASKTKALKVVIENDFPVAKL